MMKVYVTKYVGKTDADFTTSTKLFDRGQSLDIIPIG